MEHSLPGPAAAAPVLVLDNLRSAHNVGSALRTSDALGVAHVHLCGITATPPHVGIAKVALGAEHSVEWSYHPTTQAALGQLRQQGYTLVAIEQAAGATPLPQWRPSPQQRYAFVFGNEVHGIDAQLLRQTQLCLQIPQQGVKKSLNVAICMGVVLWHYALKGASNAPLQQRNA